MTTRSDHARYRRNQLRHRADPQRQVAGVTAETDVNGLPVGLPSTDIANIGAGGGSLGYIDRGGMLRVGPRSEPGPGQGPACYGHGGTAPAITDALVQLGWIRPHRFLGGKMALHLDRATQALETLGPSASKSDPPQRGQKMIDIAIAHIGQRLSGSCPSSAATTRRTSRSTATAAWAR